MSTKPGQVHGGSGEGAPSASETGEGLFIARTTCYKAAQLICALTCPRSFLAANTAQPLVVSTHPLKQNQYKKGRRD